jgi:hypothetical protein
MQRRHVGHPEKGKKQIPRAEPALGMTNIESTHYSLIGQK